MATINKSLKQTTVFTALVILLACTPNIYGVNSSNSNVELSTEASEVSTSMPSQDGEEERGIGDYHEESSLQRLPEELISYIFGFVGPDLPTKDFLENRTLCKKVYRAFNDGSLYLNRGVVIKSKEALSSYLELAHAGKWHLQNVKIGFPISLEEVLQLKEANPNLCNIHMSCVTSNTQLVELKAAYPELNFILPRAFVIQRENIINPLRAASSDDIRKDALYRLDGIHSIGYLTFLFNQNPSTGILIGRRYVLTVIPGSFGVVKSQLKSMRSDIPFCIDPTNQKIYMIKNSDIRPVISVAVGKKPYTLCLCRLSKKIKDRSFILSSEIEREDMLLTAGYDFLEVTENDEPIHSSHDNKKTWVFGTLTQDKSAKDFPSNLLYCTPSTGAYPAQLGDHSLGFPLFLTGDPGSDYRHRLYGISLGAHEIDGRRMSIFVNLADPSMRDPILRSLREFEIRRSTKQLCKSM